MDEKSIRCFRCGAHPNVLINMTVNEAEFKMCPQCFADFGLFLQGHAIDKMVCVERGHYIRKKEDDE